jgi:trehalose-6-phosphate synthase
MSINSSDDIVIVNPIDNNMINTAIHSSISSVDEIEEEQHEKLIENLKVAKRERIYES